MKVSEVLSRAAIRLEQGVWVQGLQPRTNGLCAMMALADTVREEDRDHQTAVVYHRAWDFFDGFVPVVLGAENQPIGTGVRTFRWNDAPERTKEEVVATFRRAAKAAEEQGL